MKLLLCIRCGQVFNLTQTYQECKGGHGGGQYLNSLDAKVWGDQKLIFVLGFANGSLASALRAQIEFGDSKEQMPYGMGRETKGRDFTAFVIPESASTIQRVNEKFEPIEGN